MSGKGKRPPLVCIVEDDEAIRESLRLLLFANDINCCAFASADGFLAEPNPPRFDCMLLDIRMPGTDGLELFQILQRRHVSYPIVFITGHGDIPLAVSAIRRGAHDFLTKPFQNGQLLDTVRRAIEQYRGNQRRLHELELVQSNLDSCSPREREVLRLLVQGLSNKGIAETLGISPRTVEIHRAHLMEKMEAESLPALVRMITELEFPTT